MYPLTSLLFFTGSNTDINVSSSGTDNLDASVNLQIGAAPYNTGCNTEESQTATDNCEGCSSGGSNSSQLIIVFTLLMISIRRRHQ